MIQPYTSGETEILVNNSGIRSSSVMESSEGKKMLVVKGMFERIENPNVERTDWDFEVYPEGIYDVLMMFKEKYNNITTYITENGLQNSFTFLGYQTNPYKYVSRCDLFVCTSTAEGFSTAATEALIVGTPVVTTPVAGMKEMLGENDEYGIIAEMSEESLYDSIKEMIRNPDKRKFYKKQAEKRGKDFSKGKTVKAVEKMLIELLR